MSKNYLLVVTKQKIEIKSLEIYSVIWINFKFLKNIRHFCFDGEKKVKMIFYLYYYLW